MGLTNKSHGNFVRIKDGKFFLGKDLDKPYDELTGTIDGLSFKDDEFEGQKIRKLVVTLLDSDNEKYILSFSFDGSYSSTFISFLKNADLSKPVTLVPLIKTEGDKTSRALLVSQDGYFMKSYFTKEHPHGQPDFKKVVKKSGKVEWDKEEFLEFREKVINDLSNQLKNVDRKVEVLDVVKEDDEVDDDLPF